MTNLLSDYLLSLANAKSTSSGLVEYNNNSLQAALMNGSGGLFLERGVPQADSTPDMQAIPGTESRAMLVIGVGLFIWAASGTPNNTTIFAASGGGVWILQIAYNQVNADTLASLDDVELTNPTNGQVLSYNTGTSKWINTTISLALNDLTDVTITTPVTNETLKYNGTIWVNGTLALDNLSDVVITSPSNGQVVLYNGTNFVNGAAPAGSLANLTDVDLNSPTSGDVLSYDGSDWVNVPVTATGNLTFKSISSNYTLLNTDSVLQVDTTSGNVTISLPISGITTGRPFYIKKVAGSNNVILDPPGLIDGASTYTITALNGAIQLTHNGTNYIIL